MKLDFLKDHKLKAFLCALGTLVLAILIFIAGMSVGFRKARFSHGLGEKYYRDFGGQHQRRFFAGQDYENSHGAQGKITAIAAPSQLTIDDSGVSKIILVDNSTVFQRGRTDIKFSDLKNGDQITVIGAPNDQ